ncbi:transcription termination factor NusA [Mycoplasma yeatsii]|uniref:Transcription termination/antitermination protein NusA n=1 Tax=Mycoplasma yeatsii TaxID=51365 RepID=A0ABU0NES7_9MOLU|nr:transcription termination factor NusA [Mycoplasma yeatsii]MDQ0567922.1 N utilization substance protein A [Mycoplasma yeatsii]
MLSGNELLQAIKLIEQEKNIDRDVIISGIKEGLQKAYEKFFDTDAVVRVDFDQTTGKISMNQELTVVEEVDDDWLEVSLEEALVKNPDVKIGDVILKPIEFNEEFSRMIVNQVRQIFQQKIRGAEREKIYEKFISLEGEIVQAKVTGMNKEGSYVLDIEGTTSYLWKNKSINNETFEIDQIIDVYIETVEKESRLSQLIVSRTSPNFLAKLLEREVPEVRMGIIEIKAVSREPGKRAKVAVISTNENIEPIGSIVGFGGSRINKVSDELKGEKIDVVKWDEDIKTFIINAMSPVKVISVNNVDGEYDIVVPNQQLSLAIGKQGIAAKLIANLVKTKVNIYSLSNALNDNIDILWNGNITKEEVENNIFSTERNVSRQVQNNKISNQKSNNISKKQNHKEDFIDLEALQAFQAEVAKELAEEEIQAEIINDDINVEQSISVSEPVSQEVEEVEEKQDSIFDQEPDIDEINANLEAFNEALNEFDDEEIDDEDDTIEDYDKYYE